MLRHLSLIFVMCVSFLTCTAAALACSCATGDDTPPPVRPLKAEIDDYRNDKDGLFFLATAMDVARGITVDRFLPGTIVYQTTFDVTEVWAPGIDRSVVIETSEFCGPHFEVGETYLVYALRGEGWPLRVDYCSFIPKTLPTASAELAILGHGHAATGPAPSLFKIRAARNMSDLGEYVRRHYLPIGAGLIAIVFLIRGGLKHRRAKLRAEA